MQKGELTSPRSRVVSAKSSSSYPALQAPALGQLPSPLRVRSSAVWVNPYSTQRCGPAGFPSGVGPLGVHLAEPSPGVRHLHALPLPACSQPVWYPLLLLYLCLEGSLAENTDCSACPHEQLSSTQRPFPAAPSWEPA